MRSTQNVVKIINFHLKKENLNICIDEDFFYNWKNNIKNYDTKTAEILKHNILFYDFLNDISIYSYFEKISNFIKLEHKNLKNDKISFLIKTFFNDTNLSLFFYSTIIFKPLINFPLIRNENFGGWKNSDTVLNESVGYVSNFLLYYDLDLNLNKKLIRTHFLYNYEYLCYEKLLKYINVNDNVTDELGLFKKKFRTIKLWSIGSEFTYFQSYNNLKINLVPFVVKKTENKKYLIGSHFTQVYQLFKENQHSLTFFNLSDNNYINLILNKKLYLDLEMLNNIIKILKLNNIDIFSIENEIIELSTKLHKITNRKNINNKEICDFQQKISKKINYYYLFLLYKEDLNEKTNIYFPFHFDFRGRLYYDSPIGVTNFKLSRFLFFYGYTNLDIKIADFGFSNYYDPESKLDTFCGSPP